MTFSTLSPITTQSPKWEEILEVISHYSIENLYHIHLDHLN